MQNKEKLGAQLHQRGLFRKNTTYLAKIAVVLQHAPGKMLTFTQLMDRLAPLICEDRKSIENNIRVCLSTHSCFVKIPVVPDSPDSKMNYWKLDSSLITEKMVRRHFKGILQLFPELASKVETENRSRPSEHRSALHSPEAAACKAVQIRCEVKFSSPFSIESLLKRDSPSARPSGAFPLSSVEMGTKRSFSWDPEEPLLLQASAGSFSIFSTGGSAHHGLNAHGAEKPNKRMLVNHREASPHVYKRAAPYFSPSSSYIMSSAVSNDTLCFRL